MTIIEYKQHSNSVYLKMTGHANYGEHGKDIVCSALSTLVQTMVSGFEMYGIKHNTILEEGNVVVTAEAEDIIKKFKMRIIFETILNALKAIEFEYPENVMMVKSIDAYD